MNKMKLCIASSGKLLYEGTADAVFLPGSGGVCELLPGHAPYMTLIGGGEVRVRCGGNERKFAAEGGVAWNSRNTVSVLLFQNSQIQ